MTSNEKTGDPFLDGGSSLPGVKFETVGDTFTGQLIDSREVPDIDLDGTQRTWANGEPKNVWVFDLDSTCSGGPADYSLWLRGNLFSAVREAMKTAGLTRDKHPILSIKHSALGEPPKKGYHAPKLFEAKAKQGPPIKAVEDDPFDDEQW